LKGKIPISQYLKFAVIGLVTGIANGLKEEEHVAHATAISIILPLTLVSAKTMLGGIVGGYLGAKLLNVCPSHVLRKIFAVFIIAAAVRMII